MQSRMHWTSLMLIVDHTKKLTFFFAILIREYCGMNMAFEPMSWWITLSMPSIPVWCSVLSPSPTLFLVPISTYSLLQIFSTRLLKEFLRTIWWNGLTSIWSTNMEQPVLKKLLRILIISKLKTSKILLKSHICQSLSSSSLSWHPTVSRWSWFQTMDRWWLQGTNEGIYKHLYPYQIHI